MCERRSAGVIVDAQSRATRTACEQHVPSERLKLVAQHDKWFAVRFVCAHDSAGIYIVVVVMGFVVAFHVQIEQLRGRRSPGQDPIQQGHGQVVSVFREFVLLRHLHQPIDQNGAHLGTQIGLLGQLLRLFRRTGLAVSLGSSHGGWPIPENSARTRRSRTRRFVVHGLLRLVLLVGRFSRQKSLQGGHLRVFLGAENLRVLGAVMGNVLHGQGSILGANDIGQAGARPGSSSRSRSSTTRTRREDIHNSGWKKRLQWQ